MTITIAADVRCDWCHRAIVSMHSGLQRVPLHRLGQALADLEAQVDQDMGGWQRGHHIGGPPGHPLHLCRACHDRGTPPVALPAKTKRGKR